METLYNDQFLNITARQAQNDDDSGSVLLSFTGVGHGMGGMDVQKPEFFGAGRSFDNIFFITDKTRSWGNSLAFPVLRDHLAPFTAGKSVFAIGNSMGGFNAIVASHFMPIDIAVSIVPQFSVDPACVPWETRWLKYTKAITDYRFSSATAFMGDRTSYYLLSGGKGPDVRHAQMFPVKSNIHHFLFPKMGHNVAAVLKERGLLDTAIKQCFDGRTALDLPAKIQRLSPSA